MHTDDFQAERPRLVAIATRILGSAAEAEDAVQETWLRFAAAEDIEDVPAWLTTVTTRLCLDHLRKRRNRAAAEEENRVWAGLTDRELDPETDVLLADRVGDAMRVVLDSLAPAERAAFVLHDVFGYPFDQISAALGRSGTAVRQLASRARRRVRGAPEPSADPAAEAETRRVVQAFLSAARGGDLDTLMTLLDPAAVMLTDSVGQRMGAEAAYEGADAVAARFNGAQGAAPAEIDGGPGGAWIVGTTVRVAFSFHLEAGLIREIELIADPEVLSMMDVVPLDGPT